MTAGAPIAYRHEIETPAPWRTAGGPLELAGWCLAPGAARAPEVRLAVAGRTWPRTSTVPRPDVVAALGGDPAAAACGFTFSLRLAPGAHRVVLEASLDGAHWQAVRELVAVALPGALQAGLEWPAGPVVRESCRIQGWCAHPDFPLAEVWLHYGNREVRCDYGLPRTDVPRFLPGAPGADRCGFIAPRNIGVGAGPLRLRGVTASGEAFFCPTAVTIDIDRDEENPAALDLHGSFPDLGPARQPAALPAATPAAGPRRRILFALYGDFTSNSALHIAGIANALVAAGHECVVAVPRDADTIRYHPGARFRAATFAEVFRSPALFAGDRPADLVHAWTTRENVREFCQALRAVAPAPLLIHLEDHEPHLLEAHAGRPLPALLALPAADLDALVPPALSHPRRGRTFLESADAATVITDRLRELVPPGQPAHLVWPAADEAAFFPRPIPWAARRFLGWDETHTVLFYHGNVHANNAAEVRELYAAVARLNASGRPATLIRAGRNDFEFPADPALSAHVVELGRIDQHHHLAPLMALADFFVQPGAPDLFNDYRFPSKLPEFFALGRPVILPRTNLGEQLRHGEDAWVLDRADAAGIAGAVAELLDDPARRRRLADGARAFAAARFSWARTAADLLAFYNTLLPRA